MKTPLVSLELLQWLEQLFPDRSPDPDTSERQLWMDVGAVRVIRKLRQVHKDQLKRELQTVST